MESTIRKSSLLNDYYQRIQSKYISVQGDSTALFQEVLRVAEDIGLDQAFAYLESCVIEKRIAWVNKNLGNIKKQNSQYGMGTDGFMRFIWVFQYLDMARSWNNLHSESSRAGGIPARPWMHVRSWVWTPEKFARKSTTDQSTLFSAKSTQIYALREIMPVYGHMRHIVRK